MPRNKYDLHVYPKISNAYYRLVRVADGKVWDAVAGVLAYGTTWNETDIAITLDAILGGMSVKLPATLPSGDYDFLVYSNAAPDAGDVVALGKRLAWSGQNLVGVPLDL